MGRAGLQRCRCNIAADLVKAVITIVDNGKAFIRILSIIQHRRPEQFINAKVTLHGIFHFCFHMDKYLSAISRITGIATSILTADTSGIDTGQATLLTGIK